MFLTFLLVTFKYGHHCSVLLMVVRWGQLFFLCLFPFWSVRSLFYELSPHRRFSLELETCVTHFYFYSFILPADPYCLIDASFSDLVPSLLVLPIHWMFLVHIVVGCCFPYFTFCCLTRGIPATFFFNSAFWRSLFSPFAYSSAPFEISPRLFCVILFPGSAYVVSFAESLLLLFFSLFLFSSKRSALVD